MARHAPSRLRLLHVFAGPFPTVQGTQALVATTCRLLAQRGHDVHLLVYAHGAFERDEPFTVHRIPDTPRFESERSGPDFRKIALDLSMAAGCRRLASRIRPDVVHAHHYEALCAAALADPLGSTPRVLHLHALMEPELHTYFPSALGRPARRVGALVDTLFPFLADRVVALDGDGRDAIVRRGYPTSRVVVGRIPGCPPPGYRPRPREEGEPRALRAVYAGNLDGYQGMNTLLDALEGVPSALDGRLEIEIVTASDTGGLRGEIRRRGLDGAVRLVAHGTPVEVFHAVASADMAIVPRVARGGVPVKLVNAFAAGVAVVADRMLAEHVTHGEEAWLVDMRSAAALSRGISELASSPALRRALADGARRAATRLHDPAKYVASLEGVYRDLVSR